MIESLKKKIRKNSKIQVFLLSCVLVVLSLYCGQFAVPRVATGKQSPVWSPFALMQPRPSSPPVLCVGAHEQACRTQQKHQCFLIRTSATRLHFASISEEQRGRKLYKCQKSLPNEFFASLKVKDESPQSRAAQTHAPARSVDL